MFTFLKNSLFIIISSLSFIFAQDHSLSFDGEDDYVEISTTGFPSGNSSITVEGWFKRTSFSDSPEYMMSYGNSGGSLFGIGKYDNNNMFVTFGGSDYDIISSTEFSLNTWHHVAGVHIGYGSVEIYFDGVQVFSADVNTPNVELANGKIGSDILGNQNWDGSLDELRVWDLALSEDQIQHNMYNQLSGMEVGLVAYWNFNEGEGTTLTDLCNNENNGTIYGATWNDEGYSFSKTWHVATTGSDDTGDGTESNPYATIQKGVDRAVYGDTVLVHPGTYGHVNNVSNIFLISAQGPNQTVIDANLQHTAVHINYNSITTDFTFISGFTITGGVCSYDEYNMGSMYEGGGISGGGDAFSFSNVHISNMIFYGNEIDINLRYGFNNPVGTAIISNSTFIVDRNHPTIETLNHPTTVTNCIFIDQDEGSFDISFTENESFTISNSLFFPNLDNVGAHIDGGANIVANPIFCDPDIRDYSLASNSPAIGAGENGTNIGALGIGCDAINLSMDKDILPLKCGLHQNYPNPFNPSTTLQYDLPNDEFVSITIYDMLGNVINNLVNDNQNSGYKSVQWDATNNQGQQVSAGVYLYSIEAGEFRQTKKMILLK